MHDLPLSAPYQLRAQRDDDDGFAAALYSSTRDDLRQMPCLLYTSDAADE